MTAHSSHLLAVTAIAARPPDLEPAAGGLSGTVLTISRGLPHPLDPAAKGSSGASLTLATALQPSASGGLHGRVIASAHGAAHPGRGKSRQHLPALRSRRIESNRGLCRG